MNKEVFAGDTVRFKAKFKAFDSEYIDPNDIELKVYNNDNNEIECVSIDYSNRYSEGSYYYDYTIPSDYPDGKLTYEFTGTIDNKPISRKKTIPVVWSINN
jgi:hypothetical protein